MDDDESDQQVGVWRETVMAHFMVLALFLHGQTNTQRNPSPQESYSVVVWNERYFTVLRLKYFLLGLAMGLNFLGFLGNNKSQKN